MDDILGIKYDSWSDVLVGLFALAITTVFGTPLHVLSGYLVGLEVTRQTHFMKVKASTAKSPADLRGGIVAALFFLVRLLNHFSVKPCHSFSCCFTSDVRRREPFRLA